MRQPLFPRPTIPAREQRLATRDRRSHRAGTLFSRRSTRASAICSVALCAVAIIGTPSAGVASRTPVYQDPRAPVSARVEDLLRRMTLAEKIGQMDQIVVGRLRDRTNPANGDCANAGGNADPLQENCLRA